MLTLYKYLIVSLQSIEASHTYIFFCSFILYNIWCHCLIAVYWRGHWRKFLPTQ